MGGTIYTDPESAPIRDGAVLVENGKIAPMSDVRAFATVAYTIRDGKPIFHSR